MCYLLMRKYLKGDVSERTVARETMIKHHLLTCKWIDHHFLFFLEAHYTASHPISPRTSISELKNISIPFVSERIIYLAR